MHVRITSSGTDTDCDDRLNADYLPNSSNIAVSSSLQHFTVPILSFFETFSFPQIFLLIVLVVSMRFFFS